MDAGPEPRDTPKLNKGTVSVVAQCFHIQEMRLLSV